MEMLLIIATNDKCWDKKEREEVLNSALEIHLTKSRKMKLDDHKEEPVCKIAKIVHEVLMTTTTRTTETLPIPTLTNLKRMRRSQQWRKSCSGPSGNLFGAPHTPLTH